MSRGKSKQTQADSLGGMLVAGLAARGGGAQLPVQASAATQVDESPKERLAALEGRIQDSLDRYQGSLRQLQARHRAELGQLLGEIAGDEQLLQAAGYEKFGHYVKGRWNWDRSYGYRLIDLAVVRRALAPLGPDVVDSVAEAHARELAPVAKHHGDGALREFVQALQTETGGARVTAAVIRLRRDQAALGAPELSPIGDSDAGEVVDAELVDDDAERVNQDLYDAAGGAERALQRLEAALARGVEPFDTGNAARDLSRIRSAAVRLQKRAGGGSA